MQDSLFPPEGQELPTIDDQVHAVVMRFGFDATEAALGRIKRDMAGPIHQVGQRDNDQRTSKGHRSYDVRRFGINSLCGKLLLRFESAGEYGLTDKEATDLVVGPVEGGMVSIARWEGCRRRCSDLREAGYIVDSEHERDERIVWQVSQQGRSAASRLSINGWSR